MVVESFTLQGESFSKNNTSGFKNDTTEAVLPMRGKRRTKERWLSSTNIIIAIGTIVVWMLIIMANSFKVMQLSDQNYQFEKKIQTMEDELSSYRAQIHQRTSFEPVTNRATLTLGMKLPVAPMIEIPVERKETVP